MFLKPSVSNLDFQSFYPRDQVETKLRRLVKDLKVLAWINISLPPQIQNIFLLLSTCGKIFLFVKLAFLVKKIPIEPETVSKERRKKRENAEQSRLRSNYSEHRIRLILDVTSSGNLTHESTFSQKKTAVNVVGYFKDR